MRVPRKVNTNWLCFQAWSHRNNIDTQVKASKIQNAYTAYWEQPDRFFVPETPTISSPNWSSSSNALRGSMGLV